MVYRVTFGGKAKDYQLINVYADENFDSFVGQTLTNGQKYNGYLYYGYDGAYIEGVDYDYSNMLHGYLPAASGSKTSIRRQNMTKKDVGSNAFVMTWDFKADNTDALSALVVRFADKNGGTAIIIILLT